MKRLLAMDLMNGRRGVTKAALALVMLSLAMGATAAVAETCTTQSGMAQAERDAVAGAARTLATLVQANDAALLKTGSVAELAKDFGALEYLVGSTAPKLAGGTTAVEQVYLLDATSLTRNADGTAPDAQFFCSLNRSTM